jgi:predicted CXXCH cytochrome family protein
MHNSQDGQLVDDTGPNSALLTDACVGCHSSDTSTTYYDLDGCNVPVVLYTGGSGPTSYLAGGNFYWVKEGLGNDDTKGHNAFFGEGDDYLAEAPGSVVSCGTDACHQNLSNPARVGAGHPEVNGRYGCEGCHLKVRHHANDHTNGVSGLVGESGGWYRFLSGHSSGLGMGVEGYENGLWEAGHPNLAVGNADNHNEYAGMVGADHTKNAGFVQLGNIMTAFCCGCHGDFHIQEDEGWVRHPSDAVIPDTGEYADTGGASHDYDPLSPVASPTVDGIPDGTVSPGTDMVMCLSCHRPHGSPYPDLLRWDYAAQQAGGGGDDKGCFYCHTTKND